MNGKVDSRLFNNTSVSVQVYNGSNLGLNTTYEIAMDNGLSLLNFTNCETVLKQVYNIANSSDLNFVKYDFSQSVSQINSTNYTQITNTVSYKVYDSYGTELNLSYCNNTSIAISIPIANKSALNITQYEHYMAMGINIYDPESAFYNDRCFGFSLNNSDLTLSDRRENIYQNMSMSCASITSRGCNYSSLLEGSYVTCVCQPETNSTVSGGLVNSFLNALTSSNFMVITCYEVAFKTVSFLLFKK